ncbi:MULTISPECIES: peptidoglycan endopeptidase [unclassified Sphingobium]|jgi:cell wall-associated NlpC family hydrolase|uniref:peptidoglycan endopeptidase n=1 Tax=unclassified Sphingobium TaxID=2611147 RepID=UPI000A8F00EC|nr:MULTISPECIES: peptidoglycan endopeptidase [unclassified Sphingobium]WIW87236.1 peptidoglycan endopeptidase [Sphingobium sp. V4]
MSAVVARARALLGVPFRLHGRSDAGLDCVGLAALALGRADVPCGYGLRSGGVGRAEAWLRAAGLRPVDRGGAGDLALVRPGPLQLHLMIGTGEGFVHAHAGLGRVVETPGASPWPVIGWWSLE